MRYLLLLAALALLIPACGASDSTDQGDVAQNPPADTPETPADTPETPEAMPEAPAPMTATLTLDVEGMT